MIYLPDYSDYNTKLFHGVKSILKLQFRQLPMTIMMTSRGCVYKCTYCGAERMVILLMMELKKIPGALWRAFS